jgi:uncharacterized Zn-finger protein
MFSRPACKPGFGAHRTIEVRDKFACTGVSAGANHPIKIIIPKKHIVG